jgi:hypothetical protein
MTDIREVVKVIKKINSKRSVSLEIVNNTDAAFKFRRPSQRTRSLLDGSA